MLAYLPDMAGENAWNNNSKKTIRDVSEIEIENMRRSAPGLTMKIILNVIEFIK